MPALPVPGEADENLKRILDDKNRADPRMFDKGSEIKGRIVGQPDGDGAYVKTPDGKVVAVRLAYIDTPETPKPEHGKPGQPYGAEAANHLHSLMKGKEVTVRVTDKANGKNYWRPIVEIFDGDTNLNRKMLEDGMAWPQKRVMPPEYSQSIAAGYASGKNIYSQENAQTPGEFRAGYFGELFPKSR